MIPDAGIPNPSLFTRSLFPGDDPLHHRIKGVRQVIFPKEGPADLSKKLRACIDRNATGYNQLTLKDELIVDLFMPHGYPLVTVLFKGDQVLERRTTGVVKPAVTINLETDDHFPTAIFISSKRPDYLPSPIWIKGKSPCPPLFSFKDTFFVIEGQPLFKLDTPLETLNESQFYRFATDIVAELCKLHQSGVLHGNLQLSKFLCFYEDRYRVKINAILMPLNHSASKSVLESTDYLAPIGHLTEKQTFLTETASLGLVLAHFYFLHAAKLTHPMKKAAFLNNISYLTGTFTPREEDVDWRYFLGRIDREFKSAEEGVNFSPIITLDEAEILFSNLLDS